MKVGERGQITIPLALRRRHGLNPFTEVEVVEENQQLVLRKKAKPSALRKYSGILKGKGRRTDDLLKDLRGA